MVNGERQYLATKRLKKHKEQCEIFLVPLVPFRGYASSIHDSPFTIYHLPFTIYQFDEDVHGAAADHALFAGLVCRQREVMEL